MILAAAAGIASAGPNADGTLIVVNPALSYNDDPNNICGQGTPPISCADANTELDGSSAQAVKIWKVYAAFPGTPTPRLKAVTFGIEYGAGVHIVNKGGCLTAGDEFHYGSWPASGTGTSIVFNTTHTEALVECYWFAGYADGVDQFSVINYPDPNSPGSQFADDSGPPPTFDNVMGFGSLGFGLAGNAPCPLASGACCDVVTGECSVESFANCQNDNAGGHAHTFGNKESCNPNPCFGRVPCCGYIGGVGPICQITTQDSCVTVKGWYISGPTGSSCSPNPCQNDTLGVCCKGDTCTYVPILTCRTHGGVFVPQWWGCIPSAQENVCDSVAVCCDNTTNTCLIKRPDDCNGYVFRNSTSCDPNPCISACCINAATDSAACLPLSPKDCREYPHSDPHWEWHAGVQCGDGSICATPVERTTWGQIKQRYH